MSTVLEPSTQSSSYGTVSSLTNYNINGKAGINPSENPPVNVTAIICKPNLEKGKGKPERNGSREGW